MTNPNIKLETAELWSAVSVGCLRNLQSIARNMKHAVGDSHDADWQQHIEGACGELAFAKFMGIYPGLTAMTFKAPDIGEYNIRTRSRDHYELIIRPGDPRGIYVLLTGVNGRYCVRGAITADEARTHPEWIKEHGGMPAAHFVPQAALSLSLIKRKGTQHDQIPASMETTRDHIPRRAAER